MKKLLVFFVATTIMLVLAFFIYGIIRYIQLYDSQPQDISSISTRALNIITSTLTSNIKNQISNIKNSSPKPQRPYGEIATVVIDAGHGGYFTGSYCAPVYESVINLSIAQKVRDSLELSNIEVAMTRESDREFSRDLNADLDARVAIVKKEKPDLFVSIHCNESDNKNTYGFEIYYTNNQYGRDFGRVMQKSLAKLPTKNRGVLHKDCRVLDVKCPAILIEVDYLSNSKMCGDLMNLYYHMEVANRIADGILEQIKSMKKTNNKNPNPQRQTQIKPPTSNLNPVTSNLQPDIDAIVAAICLVESDNRSKLRGYDGERGVMQIRYNEWRYATRKLLHVTWSWDEAFDRNKNISVGKAYLQYLIKKYHNWEMAVRVYNAGYHGVTVHNRANKYLANVKKAMSAGNTKWRHKKSKK